MKKKSVFSLIKKPKGYTKQKNSQSRLTKSDCFLGIDMSNSAHPLNIQYIAKKWERRNRKMLKVKISIKEEPAFERLTFRERNGHFGVCGMNETNEDKKIIACVFRLMQYEETGLSPKEIKTLQNLAKSLVKNNK